MDDILLLVFKGLSIYDILDCSLVCKNFNNLTNNKLLWQHLFLIDYNGLDVIDNDVCRSYKSYHKLSSSWFLYYDVYKSVNSQTTLRNNGKTIYAIPTEVCLLKNLRHIILYEHHITQIPTEIGNLKNLTHIQLQYNRITAIPTEIGLLKYLEYINVDRNYITIIPTEIGMLKNLTTIHMAKNLIKTIPKEIGFLNNLKELYLINNNICKIPTELALLDDNTYIQLNSNDIWSIPKELANKRICIDVKHYGFRK